MKIEKLIGYMLVVLLAACQAEGPERKGILQPCAPMPSPRASATAFVVDETAYIFAGRDSAGTLLNDLWRYDAVTDSWEDLGTTPLKARVNAAACVSDDKVYLGLGFNGKHGKDSSYLRDWWEFTPATRQWKQLAEYPNSYTDDATAFAGEGELYVGYGFCWNYRRDMFRYDIATNRWDSIDVHVSFLGYPKRSFGGTGCTCQGRHFMGTGYFEHSLSWWAELENGTHWRKRSTVPGPARTLAATAASKEAIYLSGGVHYGGMNTTFSTLHDVRRYDPASDHWTYVTRLPEGIFNHISFAVHGRVYIGLGETDDWHIHPTIYWFEE